MADETNTNKTELTPPSRREVVTKAAQVAVTAPAVAILLNASARNAFAQVSTYGTVDDPANVGEDIDALATGSNANPFNGTNQDDRV